MIFAKGVCPFVKIDFFGALQFSAQIDILASLIFYD